MQYDLAHVITQLFYGFGITMGMTIACLGTGLLFAILLAGIHRFYPTIAGCIQAYVNLIRGTPLLLQLFLVYYGPTQFPGLQETVFGQWFNSALWCGFIVLANNSMAYTFELIKGGLETLPTATQSVAYNLGFSRIRCLGLIEIPMALRKIFANYQNEVLIVLKSTSLMSTITVLDLTGTITQLANLTYKTLPWYLLAAVIYAIIGFLVMFAYQRVMGRVYLT